MSHPTEVGRAPTMSTGFLDRPFPTALRVAILICLAAVPSLYVWQYAREQRLTELISFGIFFQPQAIPELGPLHPVILPDHGYDGQFYAQVALDPSLREPSFATALDNPFFRSERIFLPALAYTLAGGDRSRILDIYALLNLAFWFLLLGGLVFYLRARSPRQFCCIAAIVLSTGALVSVRRAITDLPAATLGFYGVMAGELAAIPLISAAILTKPTAALFLLRYPWPRNLQDGFRIGWKGVLIVLLPMLWLLFLVHRFRRMDVAERNIGWPFAHWDRWINERWLALVHVPVEFRWDSITPWEDHLFSFLAPF